MPTIVPKDAEDRERLRNELLEAAGDEPWRVQYDTSGPTLAFSVDDDLAVAIGAGVHVDGGGQDGSGGAPHDASNPAAAAAAADAAAAQPTPDDAGNPATVDQAPADTTDAGNPASNTADQSPAAATPPATLPEPPSRGASTDEWAKFIESLEGVTVEAEDASGVKRAEYIAAWDAYAAQHAQASGAS